MRRLGFDELKAVTGLNNDKLKVLRQRGNIAFAFGQSDGYESQFYIELDAVAARLADWLTESMGQKKRPRELASAIIRDQWGVWMRVVAVAEDDRSRGRPVFFYVVEYETTKGDTWYMTLGSTLDVREEKNARVIAEDILKKPGVKRVLTIRHFEMQSCLADVRKAAAKAKVDFTQKFLPPYDSPELKELLKPLDDDRPDRAIVTTDAEAKARAQRAASAGVMARATIEAAYKGGKLQ